MAESQAPESLLELFTIIIRRFIVVALPATPPSPWLHKDGRETAVSVASGYQVHRRLSDPLRPLDFLTSFFSSGESTGLETSKLGLTLILCHRSSGWPWRRHLNLSSV